MLPQANSAKWEPPHGRFRHYYGAWSEYVKVGAVLRHCAYEVMALYGCLRSEIQVMFESSCSLAFLLPSVKKPILPTCVVLVAGTDRASSHIPNRDP